MDQYLALSMAQFAMTCFIDDDGMLHDADAAYQVFDGWDHTKVAPHLFTSHAEYPHQKFVINPDGTISLKKDADWVLGCNGKVAVKFVKKGDAN